MPPTPDPAAREVSVHPPHLLDSQGRPTPDALIPFCAYSGNLDSFGEYVDGFDIPVCSKFQQTLLDGQLCYSLNVNSVVSTKEKTTQPGKKEGIFFVIDTLEDEGAFRNKNKDLRRYLHPESSDDRKTLSIHVNTLSRYSTSMPGRHVLTVLKKIVGTDSFLALPDEIKGCQIEPEDECKRRRTEMQCGCVPWALNSSMTDQVSRKGNCNVSHVPRPQATAAQTKPPATPTLRRTPSAAKSLALGSMRMHPSFTMIQLRKKNLKTCF
jgi:hypothetical protein